MGRTFILTHLSASKQRHSCFLLVPKRTVNNRTRMSGAERVLPVPGMRHNHFTVKPVYYKNKPLITLTGETRCRNLRDWRRMREGAHKLLRYSSCQVTNWLIHFQELNAMLGTRFLQKGTWCFRNKP